MTETIDTTARVLEDAPAQPTTTLVVHDETGLQPWTPRLIMNVQQGLDLKRARDTYIRALLVEGVHYGKIPGTGDDAKPSLLQPGAEMLAQAFGLITEPVDERPPLVDPEGKVYGYPLVAYWRKCLVYRQIGPNPEDKVYVGAGSGSCNTWEDRYARNQDRKCPVCGVEAIKRSKFPPKGAGPGTQPGWYCFGKIGGCGKQFDAPDPLITSQAVGKIRHPNPMDIEHVILQIADKRAKVKAIRDVTACSDQFTQDIGDPQEAPFDPDVPTSTIVGNDPAVPPTAVKATPPAVVTPAVVDRGYKAKDPCSVCATRGWMRKSGKESVFVRSEEGALICAGWDPVDATFARHTVEDCLAVDSGELVDVAQSDEDTRADDGVDNTPIPFGFADAESRRGVLTVRALRGLM